MAQDGDEPRTEEASARSKARARRRGEVARSPALTAAAGLLALSACVGWLGAALWGELQALMLGALGLAAGGEGAMGVLGPGLLSVAWSTALLLIAVVAGASLGGVAQVGGLFSLHAISPTRRRPSAAERLRRAFEAERATDAVLALVRWLLLVAVLAWVIAPNVPGLVALPLSSPVDALSGLSALLGRALLALAIAGLFVGAVDLVLRRLRLAAEQRVGRRQRRREQRQEEGDPELRAERRRRHAELATLADLERATLLVFDPSGWAVALAYDGTRDDAPRVLARGRGELAHHMRARCTTAGLPVHAPPGLARALHAHAPGEPIARAHYEAVAALLRGEPA